ncbi:MAG: preprotein translocase subunit SecG [Treponema sp.]|jgi:preprotein translocase subunit SecG|nr:preprotein translocase subunit SecG [Treponema sp.]
MGILGIVLLVLFIIVAILLILLVLIQNEEGDSLGGIFAGGSASAFGSRSGNVLTRATSILGALFLILTIGMALLRLNPGGSGVESAGRQQNAGQENDWFQDNPQGGDQSGADAGGLNDSSLFTDTAVPVNPQE